jgi:signal transduction histidine kinase
VPPGVAERLGFDPSAIERPGFMLEIAHPDDIKRLTDFIARGMECARKGLPVEDRLQYRFITPDKRTLEVETLFVFPARGTMLRGLTLDVTETRRLELDLRQAQKLESVGRLAAGVAHEINTPVQFVSDSVHFVKDAMGDLVELLGEHRELCATIDSEAARALADKEQQLELDYLLENVPLALTRSLEGLSRVTQIVRSMKEFAHPEQRQMAALDLNRAVENTCTIARNEYKYVAELELSLGELPLVECHGGDVNQVILNLIVNAAHAIGDVVKGTDDKGKITVRTRCEDGWAVIEVQDSGTGIPPAIRDRVFDPFFTTKEVGRGTGQGLAIARNIICDKHHGTIDFSTAEGRGTTFVLKLPIAHAPKAAAAA